MFKALKDVKEKEWFPVTCSLKQGCSLSPVLLTFS